MGYIWSTPNLFWEGDNFLAQKTLQLRGEGLNMAKNRRHTFWTIFTAISQKRMQCALWVAICFLDLLSKFFSFLHHFKVTSNSSITHIDAIVCNPYYYTPISMLNHSVNSPTQPTDEQTHHYIEKNATPYHIYTSDFTLLLFQYPE